MAEDYVMRLVQQIAAVLAAIITKRRNGQLEEARQDLETACLQTIGLSLKTVKQLSPDAIARHLRDSGGNRYPRSVMLAELLIQDAEILEQQGAMSGTMPGHVHAFCLLADAYPVLSGEEQAFYGPKLDALAAKLERQPLNPSMAERLLVHRNRSRGKA
jgi:hypothetical protein